MVDNIAVVVTYNRKELLLECIEALLSQTVPVDILVVDNASTDGTKSAIEKFIGKKGFYYLNTGSNLGGAGGFNFGIRKAYEYGYKYIWIMDDDTIPYNTALEEFEKSKNVLKDREWGFLSSRVVWKDGNLCLMNCHVQADEWYKKINYMEDALFPIKSASFVSCYFRRETIERVGLPIKEFVIWKDDTEYTERISRIYESYYAVNSIVLHKINSNVATPIEKDSEDRLWRYKFLYRNIYYLAKKNGKKAVLDYYYDIAKDICRILKSTCDKKGKRISIICKSVLSGYRFKPEVEFVENKVQRVK